MSISLWKPEPDVLIHQALGKACEEATELSSILARCLIQGLNGCEPVTGKPNRQALFEEIADLDAAVQWLREVINDDYDGDRADRKLNGFRRWQRMLEEDMANQAPVSNVAGPSRADIEHGISSSPLEHAERRPDGTVVNGNIIAGLQTLLGMTLWSSPPAPKELVLPHQYQPTENGCATCGRGAGYLAHRIPPATDVAGKEPPLDWGDFEGPKRNIDWKPDDQDLIYTAINFRDDEWGDADEDAGQQIVERLLAAWRDSETASALFNAHRHELLAKLDAAPPAENLRILIERIAATPIWQDTYPDGPDLAGGVCTITPDDIRACRAAASTPPPASPEVRNVEGSSVV